MGTENKTAFKSAFDYKVIYAFTVDDDKHKGLIKIGDATLRSDEAIDKLPPNCHVLNQAALSRIKEYTNTVGVTPMFASGEIRQIASVEKRQFGSAEIRQFESIEKSQS